MSTTQALVLLSHFSSGMDILITTSDYRKLTQESKELLCAACEMAQLRCAKLINVRGKVSMNRNDLINTSLHS